MASEQSGTEPRSAVPGSLRRRGRGLARRLMWAYILVGALSLLTVGIVMIVLSRNAQINQIVIRQQKTANEAALATSSYLRQARDTLLVNAQSKRLLAFSASAQQSELRTMLSLNPDLFEEVTLVNAEGRELGRVSQFKTYSEQELGTQAGSPAFQQALAGQVYVAGEVEISPQSGLPVLTMAVPQQTDVSRGVLMATVSVKKMWDMLARVEVGKTGYAYIIDRTTGVLVAHSNLARSLQMQGQDVSNVPIVRQILAGDAEVSHQYTGLQEGEVIGAGSPFEETSWMMIAELPTREALASVQNMVYLLGGLLVVGALAAAGMGTLIPRRMIRPLAALQQGAREIEQGRLDHVLDIKTGDEIEDVANAFNEMAVSLKSSRAEIEQHERELEAKVEERTSELAQTTEQMRRRTVQLETSAEVARAITSVHDPDRLLPQVAQLISERFGWYHVGIFMVDEAREYAVLRAANSEGGQRMLTRGHRLKVGEVGIVGYVAGAGQPRIALDVGKDAVYFDNPDLPTTRSEMALPLKVSGTVIGALDVQSTEAAAYDQEDIALLSTLADQVAIAIENARLLEESRQALREVQTVHRQYLQQEWSRVASRRGQLTYEYRDVATPPLADFALPEIDRALSLGEVVSVPTSGQTASDVRPMAASDMPFTPVAALAAPIKLREQTIGVVDLQEASGPRYWSEDEVALVRAVSDQVGLALENVRLLEAEHEQRMVAEALREAAVTLSGTLAFDELLKRILEQVGKVVPCDASNLMLVEGDHVRIVTSQGYEQFGAVEDYRDLRLPLEEMWTVREMLATGRPVLVPDTAKDPHWTVVQGQEWLHSYLGAPIVVGGRFIGALNVDSSLPGFFTQEHADQLAAFASQSAIALQNARLMDETERRAEQMAGLNRIGLSLTSGLEVERVLETLYEQCQRTFAAETFYVALYDAETGMFDFPMMRGESTEGAWPTAISLDDESAGLTGYIIKTGQPLYIPDLFAPPADAPYRIVKLAEDEKLRSYLGVPMIFRGQVTGVLSVQSLQPDIYSESDMELLSTIAAQTSIAIENARAYQRLVQTAEELREVDRLKTQFLANMSHELRTPLNSIIGFSRVMLKGIDGALTDLQTADLTSIYNSGQHLLRMINDILDVSKIEAGRMDLSFDEMSLYEISQSVLSTARALVKDRPIELQAIIPEDLPSVWADGQRVRQVLINLLANAAKFTEEGRITVGAAVTAENPEFVTVSVHDTGIGIDSDAQQKLFVPFQQVDASTTRRAGGTGLGLSICRSFVEMQGGRIWVESELGQGSTFYFTLPIYKVMRQKMEGEAQALPDKQKKVVLAIDDDTGVITLFKRYLEQDDYQVIGVTQSRRALEMAQRLAPDLTAITLDVVMPQMDGWQVLEALKENPTTQNVPVIMCSIVEGLDRAMSMGAAACLNKPVTRDEMLSALERVERSSGGDLRKN
jgi:signal transduction histidine kinase/HAMP domain-containing protein/ActR/RegA family two-component response regulator